MSATGWRQSLDVPVMAALLVNPDAKIHEETLDRIVEQRAWNSLPTTAASPTVMGSGRR
jgi:hypothetical protein